MSTIPAYQSPSTPSRRGSPITWRMVIFAAVPLFIIGALLYPALRPDIKDLGNGFKEVDLKAISSFPFPQDKGTAADIPPQYRELDGQKIVVYGELWSGQSATNTSSSGVQLCYSIAKCCFTGEPQVQHFVNLQPAPGAKLAYHDNLVKVSGVLHIDVKRDEANNKVLQVYTMDVTNIEPA